MKSCKDCIYSEEITYKKAIQKLIDEGKIIPNDNIKCKNRYLFLYNREMPSDFYCKYFKGK